MWRYPAVEITLIYKADSGIPPGVWAFDVSGGVAGVVEGSTAVAVNQKREAG
jgi:hypothetical protein